MYLKIQINLTINMNQELECLLNPRGASNTIKHNEWNYINQILRNGGKPTIHELLHQLPHRV